MSYADNGPLRNHQKINLLILQWKNNTKALSLWAKGEHGDFVLGK